MWSRCSDLDLHESVRDGHAEDVNGLLEDGAPINSKNECGSSPLHVAAQVGNVEMVELLLLNEANKDALDAEKWTPLYLATHFGRVAASLAVGRRCERQHSMRCAQEDGGAHGRSAG